MYINKKVFYIDEDTKVTIYNDEDKQSALDLLESKIVMATLIGDHSKEFYYKKVLIKFNDLFD